MSESARRLVFSMLLVVAAVGAGGLMLSPLVDDEASRGWVQICGGLAAVVIGTACAVLSWRWWGGFVGPWGSGGGATRAGRRPSR
jgi:hypothetical protein